MRSFDKLAALGALAAACAVFSGSTRAATSTWDHNGSLMVLEESGKKRKFVYNDPRSTLSTAGVKKGTVLFDGEEKSDGRLAGYAKLFRAGCDPVDYFVEGTLDKTKGEILLQGQAPVYSGEGCKITGYSDDGSASSLSFRQQGSAYASREEDATQRDARSYDPQQDARAYPPQEAQPQPGGRDDPAYGDPNGRNPQDSLDPRSTDPEYAERLSRYRRYGRDGYSSSPAYPVDPDEYPNEDEEDDEEPAYVPYQPFWRWGN
jgi:hypothetical protein